MSQYLIDAIYRLLAGGVVVSGITISVVKYFKLQEVKAMERSLGASKVKELEKTAAEVHEDIKALKQKSETCIKEIEKLQRDYERMLDHLLDVFGKKQH